MDSEVPCVVVGSSRGLGAALVDELLKHESFQITGIARSPALRVASGRYRHIELDIAGGDATLRLQKELVDHLPQKPLVVIFNAALVKSDVGDSGCVDSAIGREIDRVGVDGLRSTLGAFEGHLLRWGGVLVGISSFSALLPPIMDQRVAYPATKAYLDMTLRCLRMMWRGRVKVVTVHLGHFSPDGKWLLFWQAVPSCAMVARKIVAGITSARVSDEINYPFHYTLAYKYLLRALPERCYGAVLALLSRILHRGGL